MNQHSFKKQFGVAIIPIPEEGPSFCELSMSGWVQEKDQTCKELHKAGNIIKDYLATAGHDASIAIKQVKYPCLIVMTQKSDALNVFETLITSSARFPSLPNLAVSDMLRPVCDPETRQEGVLFQIGPNEVVGFANDLIGLRVHGPKFSTPLPT